MRNKRTNIIIFADAINQLTSKMVFSEIFEHLKNAGERQFDDYNAGPDQQEFNQSKVVIESCKADIEWLRAEIQKEDNRRVRSIKLFEFLKNQ